MVVPQRYNLRPEEEQWYLNKAVVMEQELAMKK